MPDLYALARLTAIRDVLARFDWENDDHQLALEQIDLLANGDIAVVSNA